MTTQREGAGTPRSAVISFSRPFLSPSLPPTPGAQNTSTTFPKVVATMKASDIPPESPVKDGQSSPATSPASYSVPDSGHTFTRDGATKEQRATDDFLQQLPTQDLSSSKASIAGSTNSSNSTSSSGTIRPSSIDTMTQPTYGSPRRGEFQLISSSLKLGQDSPIKNFRPKLWKGLDSKTNRLQLDLFWPFKTEEGDDTVNPIPRDEDCDIIVEEACLPLSDFVPILNFRNLSMLHLEGMMRSYQPLIWPVVWSNPNLVILNLEMALEPLFNVDTKHPNRIIDSKWTVFPTITPDSGNGNGNGNGSASTLSLPKSTASEDRNDVPASYLGTSDEPGTLSPQYGDGEYLDVRAVTNAHLAAANAGTLPAANIRYLPVRILRLRNVVVDGLALARWFDPAAFACITFKSGCIDAGFYLPPDMQHVKLQVPPAPVAPAAPGLPAGLKLIELRGGKVVSRVDAAEALVSSAPASAPASAPPSGTAAASAAPVSALERLKSTMARVPGLGGGRGKDNRKKEGGEGE